MRRWASMLAAGALAIGGCGDDDDDQGEDRPAGGEAGGGTTVDMNDQLAFEPKRIEVPAGERVTWKNVGRVAHTVTADKSKAADPSLVSIPAGTKEWDSGFVKEGESFSRTFAKPGTYRYICVPHEGAGMTGTVVVK